MTKKKNRSLLVVTFVFVALVLSVPTHALQPNQLIVTPAFINVELSDSNVQQKTQIAITNTYASNIDLTAELKGIDEIAGKLVPSGDVEPNLDQAIKLSKTDFTAIAKNTTILDVDVVNTPSLTSGGHYASLVLSQKLKQGQQSAYTSQISISIFIVKLGGERRSIEAKVTGSNQNIIRLPSKVTLDFKNTGNMHVTPRASVLVLSKSGLVVAKGVANAGSQPLLPTKSLTFNVALKRTCFLWLPQRLKQVISFRVDGSESTKQTQSYFWYIPPVFLVLLTLLPVVLVFGHRLVKIVIKNCKKGLSKLPKRKKTLKKEAIKNEITAEAIASEFDPTVQEVLEVHVSVDSNKKSVKKTTSKTKKSMKSKSKLATKKLSKTKQKK
jgi:hypothetical protein